MSNFDLPPWLRDDDDEPSPPQPPPKKAPSPDDPAPWLFGIDEAETQNIEQGGRLSADFLAQGDFLIDSVETDLTYDEWMARQNESKRVKDIEEEIPDFSETEEMMRAAASLDTGEKLQGTAQLPDWFLGLEELKAEEEPDWMQTGETFMQEAPEKPKADIPSWMGNTDEFAEALPSFSGFEQDAGGADSGIDDFFASLSAPKAVEDEIPSEFADAFPTDFGDSSFGDASFGDDFFTSTPSTPEPQAKAADIPSWFSDADAMPSESAAWDAPSNANPPHAWEDEPVDFSSGIGFGDTGILTDDDPPDSAGYGDEPSIDDLFAEMLGGDVVAEADAAPAPLNVDFNVSAGDSVDALIEAGPDDSWFDDDDDEPESQTFNTGMLSDLNHFFDDVAAHRADPLEQVEEAAEPDFDWFLNQSTSPTPPHELKDLAAAARNAIPPPDEPTSAQAQELGADTLSWLSEINNIVNSVARGDDPHDDDIDADFFAPKEEIPPTPDFGQLGIEQQYDEEIGSATMKFSQADIDHLRDQRRATSEEKAINDARDDQFTWSDEGYVDPEPEPEAEEGLSWLQAMDTETWQAAAEKAAQEQEAQADSMANEPQSAKGMLSGLTQAEPTASGIVFPSSVPSTPEDDLDAFESPDFVDGLTFDPQPEASPAPAPTADDGLSDWESLVQGAAKADEEAINEATFNDSDDISFDDETLTNADDALDFLTFSENLVEEVNTPHKSEFSFGDDEFPEDLPSFDDLRVDNEKTQTQKQSDDFSFDLPDLSSLDFGDSSTQNSGSGDDFSFDDFSFDDLPSFD